jgi:hypothetical protein
MNTKLLLLAAAATLATAACQQEKPSEISAAVPGATNDTAVVVSDTVAYRDDARHMADRVAQDVNLTDEAARRRLENTYYSRNKRMAEMDNRYGADTTGRYTAYRTLNDDTDREVRTVITDPNQYRNYETRRSTYYYGNSDNDDNEGTATTTTTTTTTRKASRPARRGPRVVSYEKEGGKTKIVYSNGTTVKIDKDGDRKVKYPNGTKVKRDADDGEVKVKN